MTEFVIRVDPARALQVAYYTMCKSVVSGWRYVERTWRTMHDQPVVMRLAQADRKTHAKIGVAVALVLAAGFAFASRAPAPPRPALKQRLDDAAADTKGSMRVIEINKQASALEPKPVKTERITQASVAPVVAEPPPPPPPLPVQEERPPYPRPLETPPRKRYVVLTRPVRGGDICSRHGMRTVYTRGGKSWRCRR